MTYNRDYPKMRFSGSKMHSSSVSISIYTQRLVGQHGIVSLILS